MDFHMAFLGIKLCYPHMLNIWSLASIAVRIAEHIFTAAAVYVCINTFMFASFRVAL